MAERDASSGPSAKSDESSENSSAGDLYKKMFEAYGSTKPSSRELYRQMFTIHGIPTPHPAVQQPEGMVILEGNTTTQASTQGLYRQMFTTHGVPPPHPPVKQPEGMVILDSNNTLSASTEDLYQQMFTSHGRPTPITFHGSTPASASVPDLYRQMFTAYANRPGDPAAAPAVEPHLPGAKTTTQADEEDLAANGTDASEGGRANERPQVKNERA